MPRGKGSIPTADAEGFYIVPEMGYVPHFPMKWLLSDKVREMKAIAHSGYRWLCDQAAIQKPMGVLPADDDKLREYSRLTRSEWERNRVEILANFVRYVGPQGEISYHHEFIKGLYRTWGQERHSIALGGHTSVSERWAKKGISVTKMPPYADAYRKYTKEVSNKLTSAQQHPHADGGGGRAAEGDDGGEQVPIGKLLKARLRQEVAAARTDGGSANV